MLADLIKHLKKKSDTGDQSANHRENKSVSQVSENKDQVVTDPDDAVKSATSSAVAKVTETGGAAISQHDQYDNAAETGTYKKGISDGINDSGKVFSEKTNQDENKEKELQVANAQKSVRTFIERRFSVKSGHPVASVAALRREIEEKDAVYQSDAETCPDADKHELTMSVDPSKEEKKHSPTVTIDEKAKKKEDTALPIQTEKSGNDSPCENCDTEKDLEQNNDVSERLSSASGDNGAVFSLNLGIGGVMSAEFSEKTENSKSKKENSKDAEKRNIIQQVLSNSFVSDSAAVPLLVAVVMLLIIVASFVDVSALEHRDNIFLSLIVIEVLVYFIPSIFYCKLRNIDYFSTLNLRPIGPDKIYFTILCSATIIAASVLGKMAFMSLGLYESEFALYSSYIKFARSTTVTETIYIVVTFTVIPTLCRSFLFGGISVGIYSKHYGYVASCMITAFLYAILHLNFVQFLIHFAVGILLSFGTLMTGSIIFFVIAGIAEGLFALFFDEYVLGLMNSDYKVLFVFIVVSVILTLFTLVFSEGERISYNRGIKGEAVAENTDKNFKESVLEIFLSPTLLLCVTIFTVYIITSKIFG